MAFGDGQIPAGCGEACKHGQLRGFPISHTSLNLQALFTIFQALKKKGKQQFKWIVHRLIFSLKISRPD